jgi:hypothetical protein
VLTNPNQACVNTIQADILLAVEGAAEALSVPDKLGLMPLHHAARTGGPLLTKLLGTLPSTGVQRCKSES